LRKSRKRFALPDASTRSQFMQLLHDKKIPQLPDLKPSWEYSLYFIAVFLLLFSLTFG
jgi:hypothetical protein